jgi:hypothetical protein
MKFRAIEHNKNHICNIVDIESPDAMSQLVGKFIIIKDDGHAKYINRHLNIGFARAGRKITINSTNSISHCRELCTECHLPHTCEQSKYTEVFTHKDRL